MSETPETETGLGTPSGDPAVSLGKSIDLMAKLRGPDGCPWYREQTFDSIKRHTLEETYEVFDAIERRDWPHLKEELGDLLLQVLFYSQMAKEAGYFTIEDVAVGLNEKLVRRHPHVFGTAEAKTAADVRRNWEAIKTLEKAEGGSPSREEAGSLLDEVPRHAPAMLEAAGLGRCAAKVGFDWPTAEELLSKLGEEVGELRVELLRAERNSASIAEEVGDILFTAVNVARHTGVEAEFVLRAANAKFRKRFGAMQQAAGGLEALQRADAEALDRMWIDAKQCVAGAAPSESGRAVPGADGWRPGSSSR